MNSLKLVNVGGNDFRILFHRSNYRIKLTPWETNKSILRKSQLTIFLKQRQPNQYEQKRVHILITSLGWYGFHRSLLSLSHKSEKNRRFIKPNKDKNQASNAKDFTYWSLESSRQGAVAWNKGQHTQKKAVTLTFILDKPRKSYGSSNWNWSFYHLTLSVKNYS